MLNLKYESDSEEHEGEDQVQKKDNFEIEIIGMQFMVGAHINRALNSSEYI